MYYVALFGYRLHVVPMWNGPLNISVFPYKVLNDGILVVLDCCAVIWCTLARSPGWLSGVALESDEWCCVGID